MGCIHAWELPNVSIQRNPGNEELLLVGKVGISSELFDSDVPTFYVRKSRFYQSRDKYRKDAMKKSGTSKPRNTGKPKRETRTS